MSPNQVHQISSQVNLPVIRTIEGIIFRLPSATKEGAEEACVMLADLACSLGYTNKRSLKDLSDRHIKELNDFGVVRTMLTTVEGRFGQVLEEPIFNPDQAAYLALASDTPQGRTCKVRILKAYKALLIEFEKTVSHVDELDLLEHQSQMLINSIHQLQAVRAEAKRAQEGAEEANKLASEALERTKALEKTRAHEEYERELLREELEQLPSSEHELRYFTDRERLNQYVVYYAGVNNIPHKKIWDDLYELVDKYLHINIEARTARLSRELGRQVRKIDWLESNDKCGEALAIAERHFPKSRGVRVIHNPPKCEPMVDFDDLMRGI